MKKENSYAKNSPYKPLRDLGKNVKKGKKKMDSLNKGKKPNSY